MILAKVKSEKGSAFILALMVVAAVGLLVTPVIYLATTGLRSTNLARIRSRRQDLPRQAKKHPEPASAPSVLAATSETLAVRSGRKTCNDSTIVVPRTPAVTVTSTATGGSAPRSENKRLTP